MKDSLHSYMKVGIVLPVLFSRAPLQAFDQGLYLCTAKVENCEDFHRIAHHPGLSHVSRDAVEHQDVPVGTESARVDARIDKALPELHRGTVRN